MIYGIKIKMASDYSMISSSLYLGSIRCAVSTTGIGSERGDYYPDGTLISDLSWPGSYKYNGKEFDYLYRLNWLDYGARRYMPDLAQWTSVDPLAEKYYHLSPYAYCANNPVNAVDPDGRLVIALDKYSRQNILKTLNRRERRFVKFDRNGQIELNRLEKYKGTSNNFDALKTLAKSNTKYYFSVANQDINGNTFYQKGSKADFPDNFSYGVTNIPNAEVNASPDENVYIFTAAFLPERQQVKNTAHEAYGHAYFYELSKSDSSINPFHTRESVPAKELEYNTDFGVWFQGYEFRLSNKQLEEQITRSEREAIYNYDHR